MKFKDNTIQPRYSASLLISILFLFWGKITVGQDYLISFSGKGQSTTVNTIEVKNLTQNKSIQLGGTDVLHLSSQVTGLTTLSNYNKKPLTVYPNPFSSYCILEFSVEQSGPAHINVFDLGGKKIISNTQFLPAGVNSYRLSGLPTGIYAVEVELSDKFYSSKIINNGKGHAKSLSLEYVGIVTGWGKNTELKYASNEISWQYNKGDRLLYKGTSGKYSTVIADIPDQSKSMSFNFVECTDGDGNNYPVVQIGTQIWMAENLKTTKYNDGSPIPNVTDGATWASLTKDAYCWYNNDISNKDKYGALYNWHAVYTNKLAPKGWHVPTDEEWVTLSESLGGVDIAGGKLKETGTAHWLTPNAGANNEVGFTALPAGNRNSTTGASTSLGIDGNWWTSTSAKSTYAYNKGIKYNNTNFAGEGLSRNDGYSVRCLKNNLDVLNVNTADLSDITLNTATVRGNITSGGVATVTTRGLCWATRRNPTVSDSITIEGTGSGSFTSTITGLSTGTTYYIRAYATNSEGTSYGNEISFTTDYLLKEVSKIEIPDVHPDESDVIRVVSLKRLLQALKDNSQDKEAWDMYGLQRIEGYILDRENNDVYLYAKEVKNWPFTNLFNFVESLRNVSDSLYQPYCSLEPSVTGSIKLHNYIDTLTDLTKYNSTYAHSLYGDQECVVGGVPKNSEYAWIMLMADYHMKAVSQGVEKIDSVKSLWDYHKLTDYKNFSGSSRFWFNIDDKYPYFEGGEGYLRISELQPRVSTESTQIQDEEIVDTGKQDSLDVVFANSFSEAFKQNTLKVGWYAKLDNLYHIQALNSALQLKGILAEYKSVFEPIANGFSFSYSEKPGYLPSIITAIIKTIEDDQGSRQYFYNLSGGVDGDPKVTPDKMPQSLTPLFNQDPLEREIKMIFQRSDKKERIINIKEMQYVDNFSPQYLFKGKILNFDFYELPLANVA